MKLTDDHMRKIVWEALFKHDGNREKAAESLGVSNRTFYRYLSKLDLYPLMDKMGWTANPGPPRGAPKGSSVVRSRVIAAIRRERGMIDYGALATEIWGEDNRMSRQRLYSALEDLKKQGRLRMESERWVLTD